MVEINLKDKKTLIILFAIIVATFAIFNQDNNISSLDLANKNCPVGESYILSEDFDVQHFASSLNLSYNKIFSSKYKITKVGEWCMLENKNLYGDNPIYSCNYKIFDEAVVKLKLKSKGAYKYACKGVFYSSLVTGDYYDKNENKYWNSITKSWI